MNSTMAPISILLYVVISLLGAVGSNAEVCERLVEAEVVYKQEEAPRDLSGVVSLVLQAMIDQNRYDPTSVGKKDTTLVVVICSLAHS